MRLAALLCIALLAGSAPHAYAIDHKNLDEGRPLRLEDAYPIVSGEWALEAGAGFTLQRRSADRGFFSVEVLYGAYPNLQLGVGSTLSTDPRAIDEPTKSGDLQLSALYNFNQETLTLPALATKLTLNFPTGVDSSGVDVEVTGILTKSFDRLSVHLNAGYEFLSGADPRSNTVTVDPRGARRGGRDERDGRYKVSLGASYPIGAPSTRGRRSSRTCSPSRVANAASRTLWAQKSAFGISSPRASLSMPGLGVSSRGPPTAPRSSSLRGSRSDSSRAPDLASPLAPARGARAAYAYAARSDLGLMRSRDGGVTWEPTGFGTEGQAPVVALAVGPDNHAVLATSRSDVFRSSDGGRTWRAVVERGRPVAVGR